MILRDTLPSDLPGIRAIYNDAILNTTSVYEYDVFSEAYMEKWFQDKVAAKLPILVMEVENTVAGFATYGPFRMRAAYKYTVEHSVYVHPDFRQRGFGSALLTAITERAQNDRVHVMIGGIDASNARSIDLHLRHGFTEVGRIPEAAFKFGRWLDLVFVQKTLPLRQPPVEGLEK